MDEGDYYRTSSRRAPTTVLVALILLAFIAGIGLSTYAIRHWDRVGRLVRPEPQVASVPARPIMPVTKVPADIASVAPSADPGLSDRVDTIEERVQTIDQRASAARSDADRAEGMLVALAARRAIDRGLPLGYLETMLRQHFGGIEPQAVATIIGAAQRPVTLAQLQDGLAALESKLETPAQAPSFWSGFKHELGTLFVIRHADQPVTLPSDRQARATHALEQGQVDIAMTEVARMPGSGRAGDWTALARRYVLAHNALDRIETAALLRPEPKGVAD